MNTTTQPAVGIATILGLLLTILSAAGAVVAAVKANDTATITAGVTVIVTAVTTIIGRMAQAGKTVPAADEPGDTLPGLPHLPTTDPAGIPADSGDLGAVTS